MERELEKTILKAFKEIDFPYPTPEGILKDIYILKHTLYQNLMMRKQY